MTKRYIPDNCSTIEITNDVGESYQHVIEDDERDAINAAIAIGRPLLVRGEPGIGKSQLAKAAALELGRVFIPFVADAHTESRDLLWSLDSVARLAEAQVQQGANPDREALALKNFIVPGPLWWALNWGRAEKLVSKHGITEGDKAPCHKLYRHHSPEYDKECCTPENGCVVMIDEIDKADGSVPNGLLEALGSSRFHPQGLDKAVEAEGIKPLVIVTTNNERSLPDAFIRRCLAIDLRFPETLEDQKSFLIARGKVNFSDLDLDSILIPAAEMLVEDRAHIDGKKLKPLPGQAEYFDLLRGVRSLKDKGENTQKLMNKLRRFTYQKHRDFPHQLRQLTKESQAVLKKYE